MSNYYNDADKIGRLAFRQFAEKHPEMNFWFIDDEDINSTIDLTALSGGCGCSIEIKCRPDPLSKFVRGTVLIEEGKYSSLTAVTNTPLYVSILTDHVIIHQVRQFRPTFFKEEQRYKTVEDMGKKIKSVAYLPIRLAQVIAHITDFKALRQLIN